MFKDENLIFPPEILKTKFKIFIFLDVSSILNDYKITNCPTYRFIAFRIHSDIEHLQMNKSCKSQNKILCVF